MEQQLRRSESRAYEELDPAVEWRQGGDNHDVVEITLPGFRKDQVRVQVDNHGVLRATGERPAAARGGRWVRFKKDLLLPVNCDADAVSAKFDDQKLVIKLPFVVAAAPSPPPPPPPPRPPPVVNPPSLPPRRSSPPRTTPATATAVVPKPPPPPPPSPPRRRPAGGAAVPREPKKFEPSPSPPPMPKVSEREIRVSPPSPSPPPPTAAEKEDGEIQEEDAEVSRQLVKEKRRKEEEKKRRRKEEEKKEKMGDAPKATATALLVNMAAAVAVLVGITMSVWHTMSS